MKINELNKRDLPDFTQLSETGKLDFELIVSASINKSRTFVIAHPEYNLSNVEYSKYMGYYEKRMDYYSIAQIVGHKEFYGLEFEINEHTLDPRPETELIVDYVIDTVRRDRGLLKTNKRGKIYGPENRDMKIKILDIGTGSGCIPISIATNCQNCDISACDISRDALAVAKTNAELHNCKINFVESDIFSNITDKFDIITANLPYVAIDDYKKNKFLKHEPRIALTDEGDGLSLIIKTLEGLTSHLVENGIALFEIDNSQALSVANYLNKNNKLKHIDTLYDLNGKKRVIVARNLS